MSGPSYEERNLLVLMVARLFGKVGGGSVGVREDDGTWAVLSFDLGSFGQVGFHVPSEMTQGFDPAEHGWDGHTKDDAIERIKGWTAPERWW